jgi:hypothetical protein
MATRQAEKVSCARAIAARMSASAWVVGSTVVEVDVDVDVVDVVDDAVELVVRSGTVDVEVGVAAVAEAGDGVPASVSSSELHAVGATANTTEATASATRRLNARRSPRMT